MATIIVAVFGLIILWFGWVYLRIRRSLLAEVKDCYFMGAGGLYKGIDDVPRAWRGCLGSLGPDSLDAGARFEDDYREYQDENARAEELWAARAWFVWRQRLPWNRLAMWWRVRRHVRRWVDRGPVHADDLDDLSDFVVTAELEEDHV